jgi:hypothetical protein
MIGTLCSRRQKGAPYATMRVVCGLVHIDVACHAARIACRSASAEDACLSSQEGTPHLAPQIPPLTRSLRAPSLAVEEGVLASWTPAADDDITTGGGHAAARPLEAPCSV